MGGESQESAKIRRGREKTVALAAAAPKRSRISNNRKKNNATECFAINISGFSIKIAFRNHGNC